MKESAEAIKLDNRTPFASKSKNRTLKKKVASFKTINTASTKNHWAVILLHWGTVLAILVGVCSLFIREYTEDYFI